MVFIDNLMGVRSEIIMFDTLVIDMPVKNVYERIYCYNY